MSVPVPSTPTNPDLREQVANALADSNLREVGDDGTLVRPFSAKSPMAFAYADAALSVVNRVLEGLRRERDAARLWNKAHETNNAALGQTNRELAAERDALSSLLRGMARRVGEVREEMRFATKHVDGWRKRADRLMSQRDKARAEIERLSRPSVSDQTPATPDVGRCGEPAPRLSKYEGPRVWCALPAGHAGWHKADDSREWSRTDAAPSSVQGDTTEEA